MWKSESNSGTASPAAGTRVFSRTDSSNAVLVYTASSLLKQPLGYYYSTRISWSVFEVVGEIPEGIFSCIFTPERADAESDVSLRGRIRFGRQGVGQIQILDRKSFRQFLFFQSTGAADRWTAEVLNDSSTALALVDSSHRVFFRTEGHQRIRHHQWPLGPTATGGAFDRIGTFVRTPGELRDKPELRVALLISFAVMFGDTQFCIPR